MKIYGVELTLQDILDLRRLYRMIFKRKQDKSNTFILFIDDKKFPIVDQLSAAGWVVERVKDIINLDDEKLKRAQIIFVDCKGVGKSLSKTDQGLAIARGIKRKYGNKKRVIMYSEYATYGMDNSYRNATDNQMSKDTDMYEFVTMIESELDKLE